MQQMNGSDLENSCIELVSAFNGDLSWEWDSRFGAALTTISVDIKDDIQAILERHLVTTWDHSNIDNASDNVKIINQNLGGLRSGQMLLTSNPDKDAFIICSWWPWNNGETISIRVSPSYQKLLDADKHEQIQRFKGWFGV